MCSDRARKQVFPGNTLPPVWPSAETSALKSLVRPREDIFTYSIRILSRTGREGIYISSRTSRGRIYTFRAYEYGLSITKYHLYIKDVALYTANHADL